MAPANSHMRRMVWMPTQRKKTESPSECREPISKQRNFGAVADSNEDHAPAATHHEAEDLKQPLRAIRIDTASTTDSTESSSGSLCDSVDSSAEDCCESTPSAPVYSMDLLLRLRGGMLHVGQLEHAVAPASAGSLATGPRPEEPPEPEPAPAPTRKPKALDSPKSLVGARTKEMADKGQQRLPPASPNSWAEAQRLRRQKEEAQATSCDPQVPAEVVSDTDLTRRIKSILNKLTPEKFATLYEKLMQCGITELPHLEILARLVFEEAAMQHTFSGMYAELCMYMIHDFGEYAAGAVLQEHLFAQCMQLLECSLDQALACSSPRQAEDEEEAKALQKKRLIGSTRFAGELIIRCVFPSELVFTFTEWLAQRPLDAFNLERLASLLSIVGPVLDNTMWQWHENLVPVFWNLHGLAFDAEVPKRVRCLLRDVVELREAGWVVAGGKLQERPMTLDEVRGKSTGQYGVQLGGQTSGKAGGKATGKSGKSAKPGGKKNKHKNKSNANAGESPMTLTLDLATMTAGDFCAEGNYVAWEYCDNPEMYQGYQAEGIQYQYTDMGYSYDAQQPTFIPEDFEQIDFSPVDSEQQPGAGSEFLCAEASADEPGKTDPQ